MTFAFWPAKQEREKMMAIALENIIIGKLSESEGLTSRQLVDAVLKSLPMDAKITRRTVQRFVKRLQETKCIFSKNEMVFFTTTKGKSYLEGARHG